MKILFPTIFRFSILHSFLTFATSFLYSLQVLSSAGLTLKLTFRSKISLLSNGVVSLECRTEVFSLILINLNILKKKLILFHFSLVTMTTQILENYLDSKLNIVLIQILISEICC